MSDRIADHLLDQVRSLGYSVSVFELGPSLLGRAGGVELHAVVRHLDSPNVKITIRL